MLIKINANTADPCSLNPCKNNGKCKISWNNYERYTCECKIGFTGKNCERKRFKLRKS